MPNRAYINKNLGAAYSDKDSEAFLSDRSPLSVTPQIPYRANTCPQPKVGQIKHLRVSSETGLPQMVGGLKG